MKNHLLYKFKSRYGFNIIEIMVVAAISAVLMSAVGFSVFYYQKNSLTIEQVGQDLAGDLRLLQSKILAVKNVNGFIPKAIAVELRAGADPIVHYIRHTGAGVTCSEYHQETLNVIDKADIVSVSVNPTYIVYVSPAASFYAINSGSVPTFNYNATNESCTPSGSLVATNPVIITLSNGSQDYYIKIDSRNGSVTPTANL